MRCAALILALFGAVAGGCGGRQGPGAAPPDVEKYGELPGLRAVPNKRLQDELARIVEERGTPELLSQEKLPDRANVAAGLATLFPAEQVVSIRQTSDGILPPKEFEFDPIRLQKAIQFCKKYDAQRLRARNALGRPKCDFGIRYKAGSLAELDFVDVVWICADLEAFRAAESLFADDDPDEAVRSLEFMLRLASCLGAEKHAVARLEAAYLRTKAFVVLQAIVVHKHTTPKRLEQLRQTVQAHMKAWPHDADAWIGDRALGMHTYEMVRDGTFKETLTAEEIEQLSTEGILQELVGAARRNVDRDELYYLETMRKIIHSCAQPYYARAALFHTIRNQWQETRNSPEFPIVATRFLLPDIEKGHVIQAQDRANWEAWALALAAATGREMPPYETNPLTGEKYRLEKQDRHILVGDFGSGQGGDHPTLTLPDLSAQR